MNQTSKHKSIREKAEEKREKVNKSLVLEERKNKKIKSQKELLNYETHKIKIEREINGIRVERDRLMQQQRELFAKTIQNKDLRTPDNKARLSCWEQEIDGKKNSLDILEDRLVRVIAKISELKKLIIRLDIEISDIESPLSIDGSAIENEIDYLTAKQQAYSPISSTFEQTMKSVEEVWDHADLENNTIPMPVNQPRKVSE